MLSPMSFAEWMVLAAVCFAGASSPGPSLALLIRAVIRDGRLGGVIFGLAHGGGILLYAGLVTLGLGAVLALMPVITTLLEGAGIVFLLWLSAGMIRSGLGEGKSTPTESGAANPLDSNPPHANPPHPNPLHPIPARLLLSRLLLSRLLLFHGRDGFMIVFLNPKVAAFFLAIFSQFLEADQGAWVQALMVMTAFIIDTGWYVLVAFIIAWPRLLGGLKRHGGRLEGVIGAGLLVISLILTWRLISSAWTNIL